MAGLIFVLFGLVALGFLIYSIFHLKKLNITISHPRVIVEFILFLIFLTIGILLILNHLRT